MIPCRFLRLNGDSFMKNLERNQMNHIIVLHSIYYVKYDYDKYVETEATVFD